jgi:hypothetical protein
MIHRRLIVGISPGSRLYLSSKTLVFTPAVVVKYSQMDSKIPNASVRSVAATM